MATKYEDVSVVNAPTKLSYPFLRTSTIDKIVLGSLAVLVWIAIQRYSILGLIVTLPPSLWLAWPALYSKRYYELYENTIVRWWYLVVLEGRLWENREHPAYVPRKVSWWRRVLMTAIRINHPYRYRVDWIEHIGLVHNLRNSSDNIIISSLGSSLPNMSLSDQAYYQKLIAAEFRRMAHHKGYTARVSFEVAKRPVNLTSEVDRYTSSLHPDVYAPKLLVVMRDFRLALPAEMAFDQRITTLRKEADRLYKEGLATKEELRDFRLFLTNQEGQQLVKISGSEAPMVAIINIRRTARIAKAERGKKRAPITADEVARQDIVRLATYFCRQLSVAKVHDPHILNREECEDYLASMLSAVQIDDYHSRVLMDNEERVADTGIPPYHPQMSIRVTDDLAVIDGTGHGVLRITNLPEHILPDLMPQLFNGVNGVRWLSRTVTSEASSGKKEYTVLTLFGNMIEDLFGDLRLGKKQEIAQRGLDQLQEEVAAQNHVEYVNIDMAVAGATPEEIEDGLMIVDNVISSLGFYATRVTGAGRIWRIVDTAVTGIP